MAGRPRASAGRPGGSTGRLRAGGRLYTPWRLKSQKRHQYPPGAAARFLITPASANGRP